jgi:hypothetical protein
MTDVELRRHEHAALRAGAKALLAAQYPDVLWSRLPKADQRRYLSQARDVVRAYLFRAADAWDISHERRVLCWQAMAAEDSAREMGCR